MLRFLSTNRFTEWLALLVIWLAGHAASASHVTNTQDLFNLSISELMQVEVSISRRPEKQFSSSRSISTISQHDIQRAMLFTSSLDDILAYYVPGMALGVEGRLNSQGQDTIRGQRYVLMIDGVVQHTSFIDFRSERFSIVPEAIERIEVMRGGSALYGLGATGGIISILTLPPDHQDSLSRSRFSLVGNPTNVSDSLHGRIYQSFVSANESLKLRFAGLYAQKGSRFDGDGDRIASAFHLDEADISSLDGTLIWQPNDDQHLSLGWVYYHHSENERYLPIAASGQDVAKTDTVKVNTGLFNLDTAERADSGHSEGRESRNLNLSWSDKKSLLGYFSAKAYLQQHRPHIPTINYNTPAAIDPIGHNIPRFERYGVRTAVNSKINNSDLTWGIDVEQQEFSQSTTADIEPLSPSLEQQTYAGFLQFDHPVSDRFSINAGLRFEKVDMAVDDFIVSDVFSNRGNSVEGGQRSFSESILNVGLHHHLTQQHSAFASYSQGFSTGQIVRALRNTAAASVEDAVEGEAKIVDNYEVGWRYHSATFLTTLSSFYSKSELGETFLLGELVREPERIWGAEATVDYVPSQQWRLNANISWQEGRIHTDSGQQRMTGLRVAPPKISAQLDYYASPQWSFRFHTLYGASQKRFHGSSAFGEGNVGSVLQFNVGMMYRLQNHQLTFGIKNLFDKQYIPQYAQARNRASTYLAGEGRALSVSYQVDL